MSNKLCVVIPYRDRESQIPLFVEGFDKFISKRHDNLDYKVVLVNQCDAHEFNRASLLNVGFLENREEYDYFAFHDLDMIPQLRESEDDDHADYSKPDSIRRLFSPTKYSMGGTILMTREAIEQTYGWPNVYWGWGGEDRNMFHRVCHFNVPIDEPDIYFRDKKFAKRRYNELDCCHDPKRKSFKGTQKKITSYYSENKHLYAEDNLDKCLYEVRSVDGVALKVHMYNTYLEKN